MNNWMGCITCKETVISNPVGICLACQRGFSKEVQEDNFKYKQPKKSTNDYSFKKEVETRKKLKERYDAIEKRLQQIDDK